MQPLTLLEVRELLEKGEQETTAAKKTLEYLKKFSKKEQKAELVRALSEIPKLKINQIVKIADFMPETHSDLRVLLVGEEITLEENEAEKTLEIVNKFR